MGWEQFGGNQTQENDLKMTPDLHGPFLAEARLASLTTSTYYLSTSYIEMLLTTRREFERAFRLHVTSCKTGASFSHRLLMVYAAECGLKALIMRNANVDDTGQLASERQIGHDIREGLKHLRVGHLDVRNTTTMQRDPQTVLPQNLHEAFRYTIYIANEAAVIGDLESIIDWLKERLR